MLNPVKHPKKYPCNIPTYIKELNLQNSLCLSRGAESPFRRSTLVKALHILFFYSKGCLFVSSMTSFWCLCLTSSTFTHWSSVSIIELKQVHVVWADGDTQEVMEILG